MNLKIFQYQFGRTQTSITPVNDTSVLHAGTTAQRVRDDAIVVTREGGPIAVNATDATESLQ